MTISFFPIHTDQTFSEQSMLNSYVGSFGIAGTQHLREIAKRRDGYFFPASRFEGFHLMMAGKTGQGSALRGNRYR